ncbi:MAG: GNAT family N-acetyltransferase, partial [Candidatus Omnitrophica bacterium]|nr:GNAT family N-acetyltransferase [Candidatus Omnitrophota bacterium]
MALTILQTSTPTAEQWDHVWSNADNATFYHSRWWHDIWDQYTGGKIRPAPLLIEFSDGAKALFTASTHRVAGGVIKRCLSSPASTYGAWISERPLSADHYNILKEDVLGQFPILIMRFNPLAYDQTFADLPGLEEEHTQMLDLQVDFEDIYSKWTKGHRSAVTKARRLGVTTRPAASKDDWDTFYDIYMDTFQRWGKKATSRYFKRFFESMYALQSKHVRLWMADCDGEPVAASIIFYAKQHVT